MASSTEARARETLSTGGQNSAPLKVMVLVGGSGRWHYRSISRPLLKRLAGTGFEVTLTGDPNRIQELGDFDVLMALYDARLPEDSEARMLAFLRRGGGVVLMHSTLPAWLGGAAAGALGPMTFAGIAPRSEVRVRPAPDHPMTARLDPELLLDDRLVLLDEEPPEATAVARSPWRFVDRSAAFERRVGRGLLVHLGLGGTAESHAAPGFQQLVHRALHHAAGRSYAGTVRCGLLGYGAIGREHGAAIASVSGLELRAICDRSASRRSRAKDEFAVSTYADADDLLRSAELDLVVVGTPPNGHASAVIAALEAGKHVVCEKPFAIRLEEVDRMIAAAGASGRALTVYQSRRWDPDFLALKDAVRAGAIGDPFYMESFIGGFSHPCDYWHSHEPISGGTIYDWGSHYFDWMLQIFGSAPRTVSAVGHKRVWHDVTNSDQVRVDITFADGTQANFLQSDIAAALKPKWYLLGTRGALVGDWRLETVNTRAFGGDLVEETLAPAESPARLRLVRPAAAGGQHEEVLALPKRPEHAFYRNLADHLLAAEPLAVQPSESRLAVAVMEAASKSMAAGGRQVKLKS